MLKKILSSFTILFSILFLVQITTIAGATNENATNIIVESDGFCPNYPIPFQLFNETQYAIKEEIEDDLCGVNETPEDDRCEVWEGFKGKVTIHNGPIDGMPILKEFSIDKQRDFEITFPSVNDYLIIYESEQDQYADWEETITLFECKFSSKNKDKYPDENTPEIEENNNKTFLYDNNEFVVDFIETTFENQDEVTFEIIENEQLNTSIKSFELKTENNNKTFSKMKIQMSIQIKDKEYEFYKFDSNSNEWLKINVENIEETENSLKFEISTFGKYSIVQKIEEVKVIENDKNENSTDTTNSQTNTNPSFRDENRQQVPIELDLGKAKSNVSKINPAILVGAAIFILAIVGFLFMPKKRKEIDMSKYQSNKPINDETYKKTKEYVLKYKAQYNQEQIRQSLTAAKIDVNVIDKVLKEEFNNNNNNNN
jgi:hypothetical protein